jgi:predicted nucleic acid-binding protein
LSKIRKIDRSPESGRNYFLVDACFLVNKYIPPAFAPAGIQRLRIERCVAWWEEIESQLKSRKARIYVPDICIAETFKTLAKKYFEERWFPSSAELAKAKRRLRKDIVTPTRTMSAFNREIKYHDIPTSRDIIISVDRFFEQFSKRSLSVSLPDLIILATAKYLMDFYDIPKSKLHIVTLDKNLWNGTKKIGQLPRAYNPTLESDTRERIFR